MIRLAGFCFPQRRLVDVQRMSLPALPSLPPALVLLTRRYDVLHRSSLSDSHGRRGRVQRGRLRVHRGGRSAKRRRSGAVRHRRSGCAIDEKGRNERWKEMEEETKMARKKKDEGFSPAKTSLKRSHVSFGATITSTSLELTAGAAFKRAELWLQTDGVVMVTALQDLTLQAHQVCSSPSQLVRRRQLQRRCTV